MTPRVFEFPDLLLWDRAKRFGVGSSEWQKSLAFARYLRKPETEKQESDRIIAWMSNLADADQRRRCLLDYVHFLTGPRKRGKYATAAAYRKLRNSEANLFRKMAELRHKENLSLNEIYERLDADPKRYGLSLDCQTERGMRKAYERHCKLWSVKLQPQHNGVPVSHLKQR
jgi:hypothetical protein